MKRILRHILLLLVPLAVIGTLSSCHSSKKARSDFYQSQIDQLGLSESKKKPPVVKTSKERKRIIEEAYTWLGTPYGYAHAEKGVATDCSGMVLRVFEKTAGIKLPRNSAKQAEFCKEIKKKDVKGGDLVFFATGKDPERISHVGIMVDDCSFIHASSSKGVVVSKITQSYYVRTFRVFGRVTDDF